MIITKGFKYRIYPTATQAALLEHQMFIYNQAYNIALNLQQKQWEINKDLKSCDRIYLKSSETDFKIKQALNQRELPFKTVVAQQARINADKALKSALSLKDRGFPKFKNSKKAKQSFNWNNQGFQLFNTSEKFATFKLMKMNLKLRYHRNIPSGVKICSVTISKQGNKFFASFNVSYEKIVPETSFQDVSRAIGVDVNIKFIGLSNEILIETNSKEIAQKKYGKKFQRLQREQSRRVLLSKKNKQKLGANFRKTQIKLNKIFSKAANQKKDNYNKISSELIRSFDFIAVEDLNTKNMTRSAKGTLEKPGKKVKQKSGLNRSILDSSFYEFLSMIEYKSLHNGKTIIKVPPQYTSKACHKCGNVNRDLTLNDREYICECGNKIHRDINAAKNILRVGLESLGAGTALTDLNCKAFQKAS